MTAEIRVPERRECTNCSRTESWDDGEEAWRVEDDAVGDIYCIHDWDITGKFSPVE